MVELTMNGQGEMRKLIEEGDVDVLRTMVKQMAEAPMGAEVDALCGAAHGERREACTNRSARPGHSGRSWSYPSRPASRRWRRPWPPDGRACAARRLLPANGLRFADIGRIGCGTPVLCLRYEIREPTALNRVLSLETING